MVQLFGFVFNECARTSETLRKDSNYFFARWQIFEKISRQNTKFQTLIIQQFHPSRHTSLQMWFSLTEGQDYVKRSGLEQFIFVFKLIILALKEEFKFLPFSPSSWLMSSTNEYLGFKVQKKTLKQTPNFKNSAMVNGKCSNTTKTFSKRGE